MKQIWVSLYGSLNISDSGMELTPEPSSPPPPPNSTPIIPHALARSNIEFEQGTISLEVKINEPEAKCMIGLNIQQGGQIFFGINNMNSPYGISTWRNSQWESVGSAGLGSKIECNKWHKLSISIKGSNIDLSFNEVKVVSASQAIIKGPVGLLLQSNNNIEVRKVIIEPKSPTCFVVMQFTDEYNSLYREVIKPTCEEFGYNVVRADDTYTSGLIINDITKSIQESSVVIADITPNNPNVFYEVGYSHGIGKMTILLSDKKRDRLPFDVSGFRTLFYDNTIAGKGEVENRLKKHLENVENQ